MYVFNMVYVLSIALDKIGYGMCALIRIWQVFFKSLLTDRIWHLCSK